MEHKKEDSTRVEKGAERAMSEHLLQTGENLQHRYRVVGCSLYKFYSLRALWNFFQVFEIPSLIAIPPSSAVCACSVIPSCQTISHKCDQENITQEDCCGRLSIYIARNTQHRPCPWSHPVQTGDLEPEQELISASDKKTSKGLVLRCVEAPERDTSLNPEYS